jgi:hypothetical protein
MSIASLLMNYRFIETISTILLLTGIIGILASIIYQLYKKHWQGTIITLLIFGMTVFLVILIAPTLSIIVQSQPDKFANDLTIPSDIIINNPASQKEVNLKNDTTIKGDSQKIDFQIYNSFQPGIYEYDFWINKIDTGLIYLKAFEITKNVPLSESRLPGKSSLAIYNPSDSIVKFSSVSDFTIYEGDWGKPYAARFEVWFKPNNGGTERKLLTKNFKIEGWQR